MLTSAGPKAILDTWSSVLTEIVRPIHRLRARHDPEFAKIMEGQPKSGLEKIIDGAFKNSSKPNVSQVYTGGKMVSTGIADKINNTIESGKSALQSSLIKRTLTSKLFLIPAAIIAATIAATVMVAKAIFGGKGDKAEETENKRQSTQALRAEVEALRGAEDTLMGEPKVKGAHAARVMAGRNGGAAMGVDTSNPAISMNYDIVH